VTKQMIVIPIYWGEWWYPERKNEYSWIELNGLITKVIGGTYMDGLNQYGFGRGSVSGEYVFGEDPPTKGFGDAKMQWMFKAAIDAQQPFYSLIVRPGVEHLRDATSDGKVAQDAPDVNTGAYHFPFSYDYGDGREPWSGQACWVKSDATAVGTLARWVHEMAEAYSGHSEVADRCEANHRVLVDGVPVPQYWSEQDGACWPLGDLMTPVQEGLSQKAPEIADPKFEAVGEAVEGEGPRIGRMQK
jgi:hypothetical protein